MKYAKQIAEMLGVEVGENFEILYETVDHEVKSEGIYYFTEEGLRHQYFDSCTDNINADSYEVMMLLYGSHFIKKLPRMPKENETYFIPNIDAGEARSTECQWKDDYKNKQRYKKYMVCKTEDEALDKARYMLDALKERRYHND